MPHTATLPLDAVRTIVNSDFQSNTYLLRMGEGPQCVVIDPGLDRVAIQQGLDACGWQPVAVLCTHGHFDHVGSAAWVQSTYAVPVHLRAADIKLAKMANFMMAAFKLPQRITLPDFQLVDDAGGVVTCAGTAFTFHALPGHTPGSSGIAVGQLFFSGDSLYARRTALSRLPGEDHAVLRQSLKKLFSWVPGDVVVFPGHGGSATMADIQQHNQELRAFMAASTATP